MGTKYITKSIKIEEDLLKNLLKEAAADHRNFSDYVRRLVKTHPDRKSVKSK